MQSSEAVTPCILPFEIIESIIDLLAEEKDTDSLKATSLVSQTILPRCRKYLFYSVEVSEDPQSTESCLDILLSPQTDIPKYIRKFTYGLHDNTLFDSHPALLERMSCLQSLILQPFGETGFFDWTEMDLSLRSALLNLMHLPTLTHLHLIHINHFLVSDLFSCTSLKNLQFNNIHITDEAPRPSSDMFVVPRIEEYTVQRSPTTTMKLLTAKLADGRVALDFTNLKRLSVTFDWNSNIYSDIEAIRSLLKESKQVEELRIDASPFFQPPPIAGLADMAFHTFGTTLCLIVACWSLDASDRTFNGLCNELSAMATPNNTLKTLRLELGLLSSMGAPQTSGEWEKLDAVLSGPGWSCLKHISLDIVFLDHGATTEDLGLLTDLPTTLTPSLSSLNLDFKFCVRLNNIENLFSSWPQNNPLFSVHGISSNGMRNVG